MENYRVGLCDDEKRMLKINNYYMKEIDEEYEEFTLELVNFIAGKDMVEYIKKEPLDIAILDVDMIGMDGMEVAKNLKEVNEDIVVFFITGHSEFAVEAFDVDAIGYVMKPVDKEKLERTLLKAVAKVRELKAKEKQRELVITVSNLKKRIPVDDIADTMCHCDKKRRIPGIRYHYRLSRKGRRRLCQGEPEFYSSGF